jgi:predicted Zn-dependent peptidase
MAGEAGDPYTVLEKIEAYIEEKKSSGLSENDFSRGKRVMLADFIKNFDSSENIANNLFSFICDSSEEYFLSFTDILNGIEFQDVEKLLADIFKKEYRTISIVRPIA